MRWDGRSTRLCPTHVDYPACLYGKAADNLLLNNSTPVMFSFVLTFDYSWKLFDMLWRCWMNEAVFCAF